LIFTTPPHSWVNILLEEAALSRKKEKRKNNLTQVVYFTGWHTLPDVITLEYPNFENIMMSHRSDMLG
jgi:hypothetical protein